MLTGRVEAYFVNHNMADSRLTVVIFFLKTSVFLFAEKKKSSLTQAVTLNFAAYCTPLIVLNRELTKETKPR